MVPAPSLPTEIIQLILRELRPDASESAATSLCVSAISRRWRTVALSTPSLWSTFSFCLRTHRTGMLSAFFKRSLPAPLHLSISFDFPNPATVHASNVERARTLFLREADRIQHLHIRFFTSIHGQSDHLGPFVCFRSSRLKSLEIESLSNDKWHRLLTNDLIHVPYMQSWSARCPALTHLTTTALALLPDIPANITYLCVKGVHGRENTINYHDLRAVLVQAQALTELVIDGVSLRSAFGAPTIITPHLRALSLRTSPRSAQSAYADTKELVRALRTLDMPALRTLTIPELNDDLQSCLVGSAVRIPSVVRFTVVPGSSRSFYAYTKTLPGVEELVLLGSDPELCSIACLLNDDWPRLHTIDLTELEPPPRQCLRLFSGNLYRYGRQRCEAGHGLRVEVCLPRGVLPQDLPLYVREFVDLSTA